MASSEAQRWAEHLAGIEAVWPMLRDRSTEAPVALADQLMAASAENYDQAITMAMVTPTLTVRTGGGDRHADTLATLALALVTDCHRCPHMASPTVANIVLSRRLMLCDRCHGSWDFGPDPYPDCCDLCRRPTTIWTPVVVAIGPVRLMGDICNDCVAAYQGPAE